MVPVQCSSYSWLRWFKWRTRLKVMSLDLGRGWGVSLFGVLTEAFTLGLSNFSVASDSATIVSSVPRRERVPWKWVFFGVLDLPSKLGCSFQWILILASHLEGAMNKCGSVSLEVLMGDNIVPFIMVHAFLSLLSSSFWGLHNIFMLFALKH